MPSWRDLKRYLDKKSNGWQLYGHSDHYKYMKILENGEILYTRCSQGSGEISTRKWREILKQLQITQEEFNRGL